MRRDIIATLCINVVGDTRFWARPYISTVTWEAPDPHSSLERRNTPNASRSDTRGVSDPRFGKLFLFHGVYDLGELTDFSCLDGSYRGAVEAIDTAGGLRGLDG